MNYPVVTLLDREELAAMLGVCEETIRRAQAKGKLRAHVFSPKLVRYHPDDIAVWLQSTRQAVAA